MPSCFVLLGIFLNPTACFAIKYFTFGNIQSDSSNHSFVTLASAPDELLPESFTLCSSHLQSKVDGRGFYYLADENYQPWLTFRWDLHFGKFDFKIYFGDQSPSILQIDEVKEILPHKWLHVCLAIDPPSQTISVAINGEMMFDEMSLKDIPDRSGGLKKRFHLGIWYHHGEPKPLEQFFGSVSNVQIHRGGSETLRNILEEACLQEGNYLAWENMTWTQTGKHIEEKEIEKGNLCLKSATFDVAIAEGQTQIDSAKTCRRLGHGSMTFANSENELVKLVDWIKNASPEGRCRYIWTPFTDIDKEGHYVNMDTNKEQKFLPWSSSSPKKAGIDKHAVVIDSSLGSKPYLVSVGDYRNCFACTLRTNFSARIHGACQSSFLGQ